MLVAVKGLRGDLSDIPIGNKPSKVTIVDYADLAVRLCCDLIGVFHADRTTVTEVQF
jgi:hypothetical protein